MMRLTTKEVTPFKVTFDDPALHSLFGGRWYAFRKEGLRVNLEARARRKNVAFGRRYAEKIDFTIEKE